MGMLVALYSSAYKAINNEIKFVESSSIHNCKVFLTLINSPQQTEEAITKPQVTENALVSMKNTKTDWICL